MSTAYMIRQAHRIFDMALPRHYKRVYQPFPQVPLYGNNQGPTELLPKTLSERHMLRKIIFFQFRMNITFHEDA